MRNTLKYIAANVVMMLLISMTSAQKKESVKIIRSSHENKIDIFIGGKLFTSFLYPATLEKPVLYPVYSANGTAVTRGFPLNP